MMMNECNRINFCGHSSTQGNPITNFDALCFRSVLTGAAMPFYSFRKFDLF
jgi:hypothetical protein